MQGHVRFLALELSLVMHIWINVVLEISGVFLFPTLFLTAAGRLCAEWEMTPLQIATSVHTSSSMNVLHTCESIAKSQIFPVCEATDK